MNATQPAGTLSETILFPANASASEATRIRDLRSAVVQSFDTTHLSEMDHVALLRRADTKYLLSEPQLFQALAGLNEASRILEIDGRRLHRYRTPYFGTESFALYQQHHNGWRDRYKVRERADVDSDPAFLEIKHKLNAKTMIKSRVQTRGLSLQIARGSEPFLRTHYPYLVEGLEAKLFNTFQRMTLVSTHRVERLTVDVDLSLLWNGAHVSLAGVAIAELKQVRFSPDSEFVRQMRALGVRPTTFSKYCVGVAMLYPEVKHNNLKPTLPLINELGRGDNYVERTH